MHQFRRRFGKVTTELTEFESALLADLVDQVRGMLAERRTEQSDDPLAELTGMTIGPTDPPDDPALRRLLPDFHAEDSGESALQRHLHEPTVIRVKDEAAVTLLDTLPRGGGTVRLDDEQARAWMTAINDVRLTIGERIGITEDGATGVNGSEDARPDVGADEQSPVAALWHTYHWLTAVLDSLVVASMS